MRWIAHTSTDEVRGPSTPKLQVEVQFVPACYLCLYTAGAGTFMAARVPGRFAFIGGRVAQVLCESNPGIIQYIIPTLIQYRPSRTGTVTDVVPVRQHRELGNTRQH